MTLTDCMFPNIGLGFGVSGVHGLPIIPQHSSTKLICQAYENGIRYFDTAPTYGNGEAERRLGSALKEMMAKDAIVSTKVGLHPSGFLKPRIDFSPDNIETSLRRSAERLQRTYIDIVYLHGLAANSITSSLNKRMMTLKSAGLVKQWGLTTRGPNTSQSYKGSPIEILMAPTRDIALASGSDVIKVGFEALRPAIKNRPFPISSGKLFRLLRSLRYGHKNRDCISVTQALENALALPNLNGVIITTSSKNHLNDLLQIAKSTES